MKRILLALVGTVVGLVALLSFKTQPLSGSAHSLPSAGLAAGSTTVAAPATPTSAAPPDPGATATTPAGAPTATSTPTALANQTIAGQAIQTRYGVVQVQIVVAQAKILNVSFLQLTADDPRSQDINDQAGPILLQETLAAQSANIDSVSGATYTSDGYLQSLQSALDQAGIK
jgi:uncharacterized protein with FMN-binding domain